MRKLPEAPSMSRAHIPFGKIGFWPDTDTDRQTDTGRTKKLEPSYTIAPSGQISMIVPTLLSGTIDRARLAERFKEQEF